MADGPFAYGTSFKTGGQQPRFFRQSRDDGGRKIFCWTATPKRTASPISASPASIIPQIINAVWGFDDKGSEFFSLKVRDAATKQDFDDDCTEHKRVGRLVTRCERVLLHPLDDNHRPSKVFLHAIGTDMPRTIILIYEETDPGSVRRCWRHAPERLDFDLDQRSRDVGISACCRPRRSLATPQTSSQHARSGLQYDLEEGGDVFFILTNADGAKDFKV